MTGLIRKFQTLDTAYRGLVLALLGFASFSVSDASVKYLTADYGPFEIMCYVSAFSLVFTLILAPFVGGLRPVLAARTKPLHILRGACNAMISFLVAIAFAHLPLATTYTFIFMTPIFASLLAIPMFGERIENRGLVAIIMGFVGVVVVLRPGLEGFNPWALVPLFTSILIAYLYLLSRYLPKDDPVLCLAFYPALFNVVLMLPFALYFFPLPDTEGMVFFTVSGCFVAGGLTGLGLAFQIGKAAIVSPLQYTQMIWAILIGYFVFAEWPDLWTFIGAAIIIASGINLIHAENKAVRKQAA